MAQAPAPAPAAVLRNPRPRGGDDRGRAAATGPARGGRRPAAPPKAPATATATRGTAMIVPGVRCGPAQVAPTGGRARPVQPPRRPPRRRIAARAAAAGPPRPPSPLPSIRNPSPPSAQPAFGPAADRQAHARSANQGRCPPFWAAHGNSGPPPARQAPVGPDVCNRGHAAAGYQYMPAMPRCSNGERSGRARARQARLS